MKSALSFLLAILIMLTSSAVLFCNTASAAEDNFDYITYNKNLYEDNRELCERIIDGMKNFDEQIYIGDFKNDGKKLKYIIKTVLRMHPELFYVDPTRYMVGSDGTYVAVICPIYIDDRQTALSKLDTFNSNVAKYIEKVDPSMSDFEKVVVLHDELVLNCYYAEEDGADNITAYDSIVNGKANCLGYSVAYSYLLSLVGIKSEIVESSAMYHIWNKVCIDGEYYNVDLTWDDPMPDREGHTAHKYFLLSDNAISSGNDEISGHYGFDFAHFKSDSTKYDNALFHEFDTELCFADGNCYVIDNKYGSEYERCLIKYDTKSDAAETIRKLDFKWKSGVKSYWKGGFSSIFEHNGMLYYNDSERIYSYDIDKGTTDIFAEVNTEQGNCYGIRELNNVLYASVSYSPNNEQTLLEIGLLPDNPTNDKINDKTNEKLEVLVGDVDGDGKVSVIDATKIQKYLAGSESLSDLQLTAADVDENGKVTVGDVTVLQKKLASG